jgi:hypothetical protein
VFVAVKRYIPISAYRYEQDLWYEKERNETDKRGRSFLVHYNQLRVEERETLLTSPCR